MLSFVLVTACAPAPAAQPTPAPTARPTEAPKPAAPAAPTAAPAAAAKPAAAKPKIRFAFTSAADFSHVPILMALDALKAQGYDAEPVFFAQSEVSLESVNKNEAQIGAGGSEVFAAMQKGARLKIVGERNANEFVVDSLKEIAQCSDLEGKRLAIHSTGSGQTYMLNHWMKENCPQTKANVLVVSGGENRVAAAIAGQIDATPLQLGDAINLEEKSSKFHRLVNFAEKLPNLISANIYTNEEFLRTNRDAVKAFLKAQVEANRKLSSDPKAFEEMELKYVPTIDKAILPKMTAGYQQIKGFDVNGGLTPDRVKFTLTFTEESGGVQPGLSADQVADYSILNEVIQEIGRR